MSTNTISTQTYGIIYYKYDTKNDKLKILLYNKNSILEDINEKNILSKIYYNKNKIDNTIKYNYIVNNKRYNHNILLINTPDYIIELINNTDNIKIKTKWLDINKFKMYFNNNQLNKQIKINFLFNKFDIILEEIKLDILLKKIRKFIINNS